MSDGYGIEPPRPHAHAALRPPAKFLVVIDSGGVSIARLFLENRTLVSEFDAATEEVVQMVSGLVATQTAGDAVWDTAFQAHSAAERAAADVYSLEI